MRGGTKKLTKGLFLYIISIMLLNVTFAAVWPVGIIQAAPTYNVPFSWVDANTINAQNEGDKYIITDNPVGIIDNGGTAINDYPRTRYKYYESQKIPTSGSGSLNQSLALHSYIAVDMTSTGKGFHFVPQSALNFSPPSSIDIYNPAAAPDFKLISVGKLTGQLYQLGSDWKNSYPDIVKKGLVYLEKKDVTGQFRAPNNNKDYSIFDVKDLSDGGYYYEISLTPDNKFAGLPEGEYRLSYFYASGADCDTNIADGFDLLSNISVITSLLELRQNVLRTLQKCTITFEGSNEFTLTQLAGGDGMATLSSLNDGPNEKKITTSTLRTQNQQLTSALSTSAGIDIDINEAFTSEDLLAKAINSALVFLSKMLGEITSEMLSWIDSSLKQGSDFSTNTTLLSISQVIRNTALGLLTFVLILIAFANILNIPVADYGLSRAIPKIIISIVMAFFSYLIAIFLLEVANALQTFIIDSFTNPNLTFAPKVTDGLQAIRGLVGSNPVESFLLSETTKWQALLFVIILLGMLLATIFLLLVLVVRKAILMLLIAVAPLAFILNILPFTSKYYKQWWAQFWKWAFMGVPIALLFYLAFIFLSDGFMGARITNAASLTGNYEAWIYLIAAGVMIYLAAAIPLKMGSEIYGAIQKTGGKVAGATGLKARYDAFNEGRKSYGKLKANKDAMALRSSVNKLGYLGGVVSGTRGVFGQDKDIAKQMYAAQYKEKDQKETESRIEALTTRGVSMESPEMLALLEKVAGEFHASALSDNTKQQLAVAAALGSGATPANNTFQNVSRKLEGNPNKDAAVELYNHATQNGYLQTRIEAISPNAADELEKSAVKKASNKTIFERGDGDMKALLAAEERPLRTHTVGSSELAAKTRTQDKLVKNSPDPSVQARLIEKTPAKIQLEQTKQTGPNKYFD